MLINSGLMDCFTSLTSLHAAVGGFKDVIQTETLKAEVFLINAARRLLMTGCECMQSFWSSWSEATVQPSDCSSSRMTPTFLKRNLQL